MTAVAEPEMAVRRVVTVASPPPQDRYEEERQSTSGKPPAPAGTASVPESTAFHQSRSPLRYRALAAYATLATVNGYVWLLFEPIERTVVKAYHPTFTTEQTALLASWQPLAYLVLCVPMMHLLCRYNGLTMAMRIGVCGELVGCVLKLLSLLPVIRGGWSSVVLLHLGQVFSAVSSPVAIGGPSQLSAEWFPPERRTQATAVGVLSNNFGNMLVFLLVPTIVHLAGSPAAGVFAIVLLELCLALVCAALIFTTMPMYSAVELAAAEAEGDPLAASFAITDADATDHAETHHQLLLTPLTPPPGTTAGLSSSFAGRFHVSAGEPFSSPLARTSRHPRPQFSGTGGSLDSGTHSQSRLSEDVDLLAPDKDRAGEISPPPPPTTKASTRPPSCPSSSSSSSSSSSADDVRYTLGDQFRFFLSNQHAVLLFAVGGWVSGGFIAWTALADHLLVALSLPYSDQFIGSLSLMNTLGYVVGGLLTSFLADNYFPRQMKTIIVLCCIGNVVTTTLYNTRLPMDEAHEATDASEEAIAVARGMGLSMEDTYDAFDEGSTGRRLLVAAVSPHHTFGRHPTTTAAPIPFAIPLPNATEAARIAAEWLTEYELANPNLHLPHPRHSSSTHARMFDWHRWEKAVTRRATKGVVRGKAVAHRARETVLAQAFGASRAADAWLNGALPSKLSLWALSFLGGTFNGATAPLFFEMLAEMTFPYVGEGVSGNALSTGESLGSLVMFQVIARIAPAEAINLWFAAGMALAAVAMLSVTARYHRRDDFEAAQARKRLRKEAKASRSGYGATDTRDTAVPSS